MELTLIQEPYASVWVAVYEPLIVKWLGEVSVASLRDQLVQRGQLALTRPGATGGLRPSRPVAVGTVAAPGTTSAPSPQPDPDARRELIERVRSALDHGSLDEMVAALDDAGTPVAGDDRIERELSPVGVAHFFRQLYFDAGAGVGPVEQAIAVAPLETLEIVERQFRRQTYEHVETHGLERTTEQSTTDEIVDEISENVRSTIGRSTDVGISANGQLSVPAFTAGASTNTNFSTSSEQAKELAKRRMLSHSRKSAETVRRSMAVTIRQEQELTQEHSVRRVLRNESPEPVNYALRRVMRRVRVKLQSMGPRLVWQLYVCNPGANLARSQLVMFPDSKPIGPTDIPPDAPPRPESTEVVGTQTVGVVDGEITLSFPAYGDRDLTDVRIDDVVDASPEGKDEPPRTLGPAAVGAGTPPTTATVPIDPGSAERILVHYAAYYTPSEDAINEWNAKVSAARAAFAAEQFEQQFEQSRRLVEAKRGIAPRPAADLRGEERYEILRRMVEEGFGKSQARGPAPLEIELFHRLFDVESLFYYAHPSWWHARRRAHREDYEITDSSQHAPFGSSLGWTVQLDGDRRRNEFLNSPWVRVCIPIHAGLERSAIEWLSKHVEGQRGFDVSDGSVLGDLLASVEDRREAENLPSRGPDYVTLDGTDAPDGDLAPETWPILDEFEVLEPTEGFVYERIELS